MGFFKVTSTLEDGGVEFNLKTKVHSKGRMNGTEND